MIMCEVMYKAYILFILFLFFCSLACYSEKGRDKYFRIMEYNVENLFDCTHDSLKEDRDFTPEGMYSWTRSRYWRKVNAVARAIVLASNSESDNLHLPDIIGVCEVENDSVLNLLTKASLLKAAGYEYIVTSSPDVRGIDVALLYQPFSFRHIMSYPLRVEPVGDMRPTRDILYVKGETFLGDMHVYIVHTPSRRGGEKVTRVHRRVVINRLTQSVDSVFAADSKARIVVMGDFNDYSSDENLCLLASHRLVEISGGKYLTERKGIGGTYRYRGVWGALDHIFVSEALLESFSSANIGYHPMLVEPDEHYGGVKPYRFILGPVEHGGFSDHLPLIATFRY